MAWVLGFAGYVANVEQTQGTLEAIRALMTLAPIAIMVVLIVAARAYRLDSLKAVFTNPPLLVVIVMFTCGMLSFTVRQTVSLYYFQYNLGRGDLIPLFFLLTMPVMFVGLLFVPKLAAVFGKAGGIVIGAVVVSSPASRQR